MATAAYTTLCGEIAPHVPGCPNAVIGQYIRKVVIDLCERAKVWRVRADPLILTSGTYSYQLSTGVAETEVASPISAKVKVAATGRIKPLAVPTIDVLSAQRPGWPEDGITGEPEAIAQLTLGTFDVQPIPDAATTYTVYVTVAIKPTLTSSGCDGVILSDFRRAIFHGVLHELMLLPDRKWSDDKTGVYHGKQWEYHLNLARAKARHGFGQSDVQVQQRPLA